MTNDSTKLRPAVAADQPALEKVAVDSGLFQPEEVGEFGQVMSAFFAGETEGDFWVVYEDEKQIIGGAYCGTEGFADRVHNLYFIAVDPAKQGNGVGSSMLAKVEQTLSSQGARVLIIETSGLGTFDLTRKFYAKHGYSEEARIREYYGPGDDKVVFWKKLESA